ncbi:Molecular chaperone (Small heat shock protein) [Hyella patelloides LEGE 07179]|uniref:Molecular chaperone (Small heat shock protein) n=1 Tax=Hyella patelloides LEGE 07179 TaxID=945734 RepID=A0A563VVI1_9CYAN|nr:Hsp20/alpha crystallin family protein [Hyella patelloides]VEP15410.1 Molecular chaperone (Small heat shock protein) [Hyella patelloides LEGE 07179]
MAIVRYNPWQEMNSLQRQLNHLFNDALNVEDWNNFGNWSSFPAAEITEKEDAFHLKLEVPGMEAKDIDIQVMADRVAIAGERKSETKSEENGSTRLCGAVSFRTEFRYGKFQRVIPLPARIQNTNVTAQYKDGILNLTLPKSEEEKNKVVKVNLGEANA